MFRKELFKRAFSTLVLVGLFDVITSKLYLQWTIWWVDIILHFLGGLAVALFAFWIGSSRSSLKNWSKRKILLTALISAIVVGILWELCELYFGLTFLSDGIKYWTNTGSDLLMDVVGGVFGFILINNLLKKYEQ